MKEKLPIPDDYAFHWSFLALNNDEMNFESSRIVVLPVPYDSTTSYRSGAKEGPSAIIEASRYLEDYDLELDCEISDVGIYTLPELDPNVDGPYKMTERVKNVSKAIFESGKILAMLGGEHSITPGCIAPFTKKYKKLCLLHFDAHADLRESYNGEKFSHASAIRRCLDYKNVSVISFGIRNISQSETLYLKKNSSRIKIFWAKDKVKWNLNKFKKMIKNKTVYLTFDVDGLDSSIMPATGTPEPGGLFWDETLKIIKIAAKNSKIVGADINELSPIKGFNSYKDRKSTRLNSSHW